MPFNYKDMSEVRERLLERNAKWQAELDRISKTTKDGYIKAISTRVAEVADELAGVSTFHTDKICENQKLAEKAIEASGAALESSSAALEAQKQMEKNLKESETKIDTNTKRGLKSIHERQRADLEKCQNVVIGRGILPLVQGKESYGDLEAAALTAFKKIGIKKGMISISYVRRLSRGANGEKSKRTKEPQALRIELGSLGDKIKLYEAMIESLTHKHVEFSLTSEIPKYALPKYRRLGKLAKALRDNDRRMKTKVTIPRGKLQPVLQVKKRGTGEKYKAASEDQLKLATELWEKARKDKDDELLRASEDEDEDMETDSGARGK
jgi:hypothetical protein